MEIKLSAVTLYNIHLRATHSNYTERRQNARDPGAAFNYKKYESGFHILTGDFNTLAPGELLNMQKLPMRYRMLAMVLGGRVTYRTIQIMFDAGYIDCLSSAEHRSRFHVSGLGPARQARLCFHAETICGSRAKLRCRNGNK